MIACLFILTLERLLVFRSFQSPLHTLDVNNIGRSEILLAHHHTQRSRSSASGIAVIMNLGRSHRTSFKSAKVAFGTFSLPGEYSCYMPSKTPNFILSRQSKRGPLPEWSPPSKSLDSIQRHCVSQKDHQKSRPFLLLS